MSLTLNGSSPAITFPDGSTQTTAVNITAPYTANGVVYASSTSALATGSALTFDGSKFVASGSNEAIRIANTAPYLSFYNSAQTTQYGYIQHTGTDLALVNVQNGAIPFYTNNTERMRLTSAGYLGIGTSSPSYILDAYASGSADVARFKSGQSSGIVHIQDSSGNGIDIYGSTAYGHRIYTNNSQALLLGTNSTTQATLDTSGNLGLGVIPSAWSGIGAIELPHGVAFTANTGSSTPAMYQVTNAYYNGTNWIYKQTAAATQYQQYAGQHQWWNAPSGTAGNPVTFTQAMTLDNSGKLLVGKTSSNSSATGAELQNGVGGNASCVLVADGNSVLILNRLTSTGSIVDIRYSGTSVGSISYNGSATLYNSTSDQRLKTDLGQVTLTNVIDETIVHDFVWKTDGTQSRGVFAQEAHKVIPQAVKVGDDGEEVEDAWGVDYSKYVPDLIVYCQQLNAEIQSLKAEVATLKGA